MAQGTVDVEDLNKPQLIFTIEAMAMVMDNLIQDDMELDESGQPLPADMQKDLYIRQAMKLLNYK